MIVYLETTTVMRCGITPLSRRRDTGSPEWARAREVLLRERGNGLLEWGAKSFFFHGMLCLQLSNVAGKLTLVLADFRPGDHLRLTERMRPYMEHLYRDYPEVLAPMERWFAQSPEVVYEPLGSRRLRNTLMDTELYVLWEGHRLAPYVGTDGMLDTLRLNLDLNTQPLTCTRVEGQQNYVIPGEHFARELIRHYGQGPAAGGNIRGK